MICSFLDNPRISGMSKEYVKVKQRVIEDFYSENSLQEMIRPIGRII
jgi:hypothetical protein